eukprot:COSAG02_NODE_49101_length_329_cov_0.669565_2_plen_56_part_01
MVALGGDGRGRAHVWAWRERWNEQAEPWFRDGVVDGVLPITIGVAVHAIPSWRARE